MSVNQMFLYRSRITSFFHAVSNDTLALSTIIVRSVTLREACPYYVRCILCLVITVLIVTKLLRCKYSPTVLRTQYDYDTGTFYWRSSYS